MTSFRHALGVIRRRYHPLFYYRRNPVVRRAIALVDKPMWLRFSGVSFKVRGKIITHGIAVAWTDSHQEASAEALALACVRRFGLKSFWDVGANIGFYSWLLLSSTPALHAVLFEPLPFNCELIAATIRRANLSCSAELVSAAVSDASGFARLRADDTAGTTSSLDRRVQTFEERHWNRPPRDIEVATVSIDDARLTRTPIEFLKVDVEGHEDAVLRGGRETLKRDQPLVFIECTHTDKHCLHYLEQLHYRLVDADRLSTQLAPGSTNFFAFPASLAASAGDCLSLAQSELSSKGEGRQGESSEGRSALI